ncbi:hypothetical protein [Streptomyces aureoverticillatus]|uniref:hypothetical protein n=1 Tax=Streptomyces aureoverticillatus TaxID=66871 RepID=UPI0013DC997F|nr:hypothetical protein [Streptomyces aureoverticillatus]QIB44413.1 hypothetical protein G3H79_16300 [Streptomyces aureoverticillatus]
MPQISAFSTDRHRSRRARRTVAALVGAAALATLGTVNAPTATAGPVPPGGSSWDHVWSGTGVKVYVKERGDIISVCDTAANGHSAWTTVDRLNPDVEGYKMYARGGKGSCTSHSAAEGGRYNLAEGGQYTLNFEGRGDNGGTVAGFINDH